MNNQVDGPVGVQPNPHGLIGPGDFVGSWYVKAVMKPPCEFLTGLWPKEVFLSLELQVLIWILDTGHSSLIVWESQLLLRLEASQIFLWENDNTLQKKKNQHSCADQTREQLVNTHGLCPLFPVKTQISTVQLSFLQVLKKFLVEL